MSTDRPLPHAEAFELNSLSSDDEQPDSPIAMQPPQPKWMTDSRPPWLSRLSAFPIHLLKPRLTWRYILFSIFCVYALYCLIRGSPLLASRLPGYSGPHGVGAIDLEIPLPNGPQIVSNGTLKSTEQPAFEVQTLLATIYYPTAKTFHSRKARYPWISKPISLTAKGYARFAHVDNFLIRPVFSFGLWLVAGGITVPAEVDAPIVESESGEGVGEFPVTVFSHGMASSRTDYTHFLGELASRGQVLVAIEHRDGSGPGSLVKTSVGDKGREVLPLRSSDLEVEVEAAEFKRAQLGFRDAEIFAAVELLHSINNGTAITNTRDPVTTFPWEGRLNMSHLTLAGHSYGATGALQALSSLPTHLGPPSCGIILDPGKSSGPLNHNATVPLLIVHSNSWSASHSIFFGRPHFDTVRDLVRGVPAPSWFLTSIGTSHPSVTDAPLLEPLLLSWTTGAMLDVEEALKEYVRVAYDFGEFVGGGERRGVLNESVTHEEYGVWVSEEREKEFPKEMARLWEVHVAPDELGKSVDGDEKL